MTRMFRFIGPRWNPIWGCKHYCYHGRCWAALMARRIRRFRGEFNEPKLIEKELDRTFGEEIVFVTSMGDMWGEWVPDCWIQKVIGAMFRSEEKTDDNTIFFVETKNPERFLDYYGVMPSNTVFSTTIETNRNYHVSNPFLTPTSKERYEAMKKLPWYISNHVSIEPIMDFDHDILLNWIKDITPLTVSVGYDNYHAYLPEPSLEKTLRLIEDLEKWTHVERKTLRNAVFKVESKEEE